MKKIRFKTAESIKTLTRINKDRSSLSDCDFLSAFLTTHTLRSVLESAELKWNEIKNDK